MLLNEQASWRQAVALMRQDDFKERVKSLNVAEVQVDARLFALFLCTDSWSSYGKCLRLARTWLSFKS
jgi:hypothetical protein